MKNGDKYIGWKIFFWIIGGIVGFMVLVGTFLYNNENKLEDKIDRNFIEISTIKADISSIDTNLEWITDQVKNGKETGWRLFGPVVFNPNFRPNSSSSTTE